jgi:hypothetical protein
MRTKAWLCFNDWAGFTTVPVVLVGETRTRWRITPDVGVDRIRLAGRRRWLAAGETALVPKTAVRAARSLTPEHPADV